MSQSTGGDGFGPESREATNMFPMASSKYMPSELGNGVMRVGMAFCICRLQTEDQKALDLRGGAS